MLQLEVKAALQIAKPAHEVFEAIVDPEKMKHYFISYSTGRMEEEKQLVWRFPEFADDVPISMQKVDQGKLVSFSWNTATDKQLLVEIRLNEQHNGTTVVRVTEKSMENNAEGIAWLIGNTEEWTNFLACMKAYLEYGINLRKGGFDFMKQ